jgi:hypothetical protein
VLQLHHTERLREREEHHEQQAAACAANASKHNNSSSSSCPAAASNSSNSWGSSLGSSDPNSDAFMSELSLLGEGLKSLPENCRALCGVRSPMEEREVQRGLHRALPLLPLELKASRRIRYVRVLPVNKLGITQ